MITSKRYYAWAKQELDKIDQYDVIEEFYLVEQAVETAAFFRKIAEWIDAGGGPEMPGTCPSCNRIGVQSIEWMNGNINDDYAFCIWCGSIWEESARIAAQVRAGWEAKNK